MVKGLAKHLCCLRHGRKAKYVDASLLGEKSDYSPMTAGKFTTPEFPTEAPREAPTEAAVMPIQIPFKAVLKAHIQGALSAECMPLTSSSGEEGRTQRASSCPSRNNTSVGHSRTR